MKSKFLSFALVTTIAALSTATFAQIPGFKNPLGGNSGSSGDSVTAEQLVKKYVGGTQNVMSAEVYMLKALGLKDQAAKEELAAKNLTEGSTSAGLEDAAKVQTESSKALAEKLGEKNVVLSADSKKQYSLGLVELVKGIRDYIGLAADAKGFKPSLTAMGGAASAAVYIVKSLPGSTSNMKSTLGKAIDFAKQNKIEVPADATSLL